MSEQAQGKDENKLALEDKLDVARTLLTLKGRISLRHEKNLVETAIKQSHKEEVNRGEVSLPALPGTDEILRLFAGGAPALQPGTDEAEPGK